MNMANEDDNWGKNQLTTTLFFPSINSLDLSFALFLIFSFWYRVWFGKTKLAISILIHLQYSCECDLAALHCLCKHQNVKLDRALMLELWNSSPTYLNEVNKDEFCLHSVCIILCLLFGKHYYTPMWTWLRVCFCLLELNYGLRQWQRHRWQTTTTIYDAHIHLYICIHRKRISEHQLKRKILCSVGRFGSFVRSFPLCSYIFSLLPLLLFAFYMLFVL